MGGWPRRRWVGPVRPRQEHYRPDRGEDQHGGCLGRPGTPAGVRRVVTPAWLRSSRPTRSDGAVQAGEALGDSKTDADGLTARPPGWPPPAVGWPDGASTEVQPPPGPTAPRCGVHVIGVPDPRRAAAEVTGMLGMVSEHLRTAHAENEKKLSRRMEADAAPGTVWRPAGAAASRTTQTTCVIHRGFGRPVAGTRWPRGRPQRELAETRSPTARPAAAAGPDQARDAGLRERQRGNRPRREGTGNAVIVAMTPPMLRRTIGEHIDLVVCPTPGQRSGRAGYASIEVQLEAGGPSKTWPPTPGTRLRGGGASVNRDWRSRCSLDRAEARPHHPGRPGTAWTAPDGRGQGVVFRPPGVLRNSGQALDGWKNNFMRRLAKPFLHDEGPLTTVRPRPGQPVVRHHPHAGRVAPAVLGGGATAPRSRLFNLPGLRNGRGTETEAAARAGPAAVDPPLAREAHLWCGGLRPKLPASLEPGCWPAPAIPGWTVCLGPTRRWPRARTRACALIW